MNFHGIKRRKMKTPTRDTDQIPGAIAYRDGEGEREPPPPPPPPQQQEPEPMDIESEAGGDGESDERALQTTSSDEGDDFYKKKLMVKPPADDVCPICFDDFYVPCRAPCGHWYCGGCILQYWNYSSSMLPCKCPMCLLSITKLTPEASCYHRREVEIRKVLRRVGDYNRLYVGSIKGFILNLPAIWLFYLKWFFCDILDPDRPVPHFPRMRIISVKCTCIFPYIEKGRALEMMLLGPLYWSITIPFDFSQLGQWNIPGPWSYMQDYDYVALALMIIIYFVKMYLRRRRDRNARELMMGLPV